MRYLTFNRQKRLHSVSEGQPVPVYLKRGGRYGIQPATGADDPQVLVEDRKTGEFISKTELAARGVGIITPPPPPPPTINWQSAPAVGGTASTDWELPPGNYINEDPTKNMFGSKYGSGRIIIDGSRIKSAGPIVGGYRGKLTITNSILESIRPSTLGQSPRRLINIDEIRDFVLEGCTILYTAAGIYLTGTLDANGKKIFAGDAAAGDGFRIRRNVVRDVDGWIFGRRSNWTGTKPGDKFTASGAQMGAIVANFVQWNGTPGANYLVEWNEVLNALGCWAEDMYSMFDGAGGHPDRPAIFRDLLTHNTGARDWNYQAGVSTSYNGGEQITLNADPGNTATDVQYTGYSGTSHLIGDGLRTDKYLSNSCYVTMRRHVAFGFRPILSIQAGHHNTIDDCEVYACDRHYTGVPYSGLGFQDFQITDYHNGATAADTGQIIFGQHVITNNRRYRGSTTAAITSMGDGAKNGGTVSGNQNLPAVTDGGAALITAFRARAQAAGVTLGSTLPT